MSVQARARVQVTLEIDVSGGAWGPDCKVEQVFQQGGRDAIESLERVLDAARQGLLWEHNPALNPGDPHVSVRCRRDLRARVIGEPKVTAVIAGQT